MSLPFALPRQAAPRGHRIAIEIQLLVRCGHWNNLTIIKRDSDLWRSNAFPTLSDIEERFVTIEPLGNQHSLKKPGFKLFYNEVSAVEIQQRSTNAK